MSHDSSVCGEFLDGLQRLVEAGTLDKEDVRTMLVGKRDVAEITLKKLITAIDMMFHDGDISDTVHTKLRQITVFANMEAAMPA